MYFNFFDHTIAHFFRYNNAAAYGYQQSAYKRPYGGGGGYGGGGYDSKRPRGPGYY